jgi:hypothetical protein
MSQAENLNTMSPSRRTVLAGISVAVAPAVAAVDKSLGAVALGDDPIFAAIDQHRQAWRAEEQALARFDEIDDDPAVELVRIILGEYPETTTETVEVTSEVFHVRHVPTGRMIPIVAHCPRDIERDAPRKLTAPERAAWIEEKNAELERVQARHDDQYEVSARGIAEDAWSDAGHALECATAQLAATRPTTAAGVAAALVYWAELPDADRVQGYTEDFLKGLAQAVRAIG